MIPAVIPIAIRIIMFGLSIAGGVLGIAKLTEKGEQSQFNKGVCPKCAGHFKHIPGTEVKGAKGYRCDVCDNCVWVSFGSDHGYTYTPSKNARN